ncbi:MAG: copper-binding protein [Candidatus Competibacteraceae bacterium]|nr:copper-binding protein [Candidatus Competibacteraceae bacterium]
MNKPWLISVSLAALLSVAGACLATEGHDHGAAHAPASEAIAATGTVKSVDAAAGKLVIDHDPIPALNWPRMVMDFQLTDPMLAEKVKAGDAVQFTMMPGERRGSYLINAIEPAP